MSEGNHTKKEFLSRVRNISKKELDELLKDLHKELSKGRMDLSRGQNPYTKGEYNIKIIKWKIAQVRRLKDGSNT